MDFSKRVGFRIRKLRLERNLTQFDLANLLRYERSRICRLELGQSAITVDLLLEISNALQVSIFDLLPVEVRLKNDEISPQKELCPLNSQETTPSQSSQGVSLCPMPI